MAGFVKAQAQNFLGTDTTNKVVQKWGNVAQKVDKAAQKVYEVRLRQFVSVFFSVWIYLCLLNPP